MGLAIFMNELEHARVYTDLGQEASLLYVPKTGLSHILNERGFQWMISYMFV